MMEIDTASKNHRIVANEKGNLYLNNHKLRNVLYSPQSNGGIISVSSLTNENFVSIFFKGKSITIPRTIEVEVFLHKERKLNIKLQSDKWTLRCGKKSCLQYVVVKRLA